MITVILCGVGFGTGSWVFWYGLRPPREDLADALVPTAAAAPSPMDGGETGWAARAGAALVPLWKRCGLPGAKMTADLRTLGIPVERHLAEKTTAAAAGLVLPVLLASLLALAGVRIGWALPVWGSLVFAGALSFAPDMIIRQKAAERRAEVRHALSVMLDLTVVALSGGAGVEQALTASASAGHGVGFTAFRRALQQAEVTRSAAWGPLGELGAQLGVTELSELAAAAALAGSEGARVKNSLATKAATLRGHLLAESESDAASATERMSLPVVTLFGGFLLFLGYPAVTHALSGL